MNLTRTGISYPFQDYVEAFRKARDVTICLSPLLLAILLASLSNGGRR